MWLSVDRRKAGGGGFVVAGASKVCQSTLTHFEMQPLTIVIKCRPFRFL